MAIEKGNLKVGTKLVGHYKKETYRAEVVQTEEGVGFLLEDGRQFKSLSAAGSAVMGGVACNGWRFWSLVGEMPEADAAQKEQPEQHKGKLLRRVPNQKGVPEGQTRWWCNGCAASFLAEGDGMPEACPQGHRLDGNGDVVTVPTEPGETEELPAV